MNSQDFKLKKEKLEVENNMEKPLLNLLGVDNSIGLWLYIPIRIAIVFPIYQILIIYFEL